jgi:hypothetical protein
MQCPYSQDSELRVVTCQLFRLMFRRVPDWHRDGSGILGEPDSKKVTTSLNTRILYAAHDGGIDLAVVDITNPAFTVVVKDDEIAAMAGRHTVELAQQKAMGQAIQEALQQSQIGRSLQAASGSYLAGMPTYILKLGPENLGAAETNPIDRHIAASFPALALRIRLQDMARLLADGLAGMSIDPPRQVRFINIAGGPASDSWNALILLQAERPEVLEGRKIGIAILDLDEAGPAFGRRAVVALCAPGAPLSGLDIAMQHVSYAWSDANRMRPILQELNAREAACAISSEGGLFEYGSDAEVVANLTVLDAETGPDAIVVGSVTRESELMRASQSVHRILLQPRTMERFRTLAAEAGWVVKRSIERPLSYHVLLAKK